MKPIPKESAHTGPGDVLSALVADAVELVGPHGDALRLVLLRLSRRRAEDTDACTSVDRALSSLEE